MNKFKILFLYPNGTLMNPPPISIGIFTALLKQRGFDLALFDTTLYPEQGKFSDEAKQDNLQVKSFDFSSRGIKLKITNMQDDLRAMIKSFSPDLILISMLECTYMRAFELLTVVKEFDVLVLAGGVFPTFAAERVLINKAVDIICIGEGEETIIEFCERLRDGKDWTGILNLCYRKNGRIVRNRIRKPVDLNELPVPDYSLFEKERFFRPMAGSIYRTVPVETSRGCPFTCSFCNSPSLGKIYRDNGYVYFRKKSIPALIREINSLINQWEAEYVYFASDNFLVGSDDELDRFIEFYKDIKLPFWIQSRPETVTKKRIQKLKNVGCHRMSMGLEHGNVKFRTTVLKKKFDNDTMVNASKIIAEIGIPLTVNNIIGFPGETRELIFDTIELNRRLSADSINCAVFAPFHGTPLHKECVEKGYIKDDLILSSINTCAPLSMPQLSSQVIQGLRRTFVLYVRMPKEYWPQIKMAEVFDKKGEYIFAQLKQIYADKYAG